MSPASTAPGPVPSATEGPLVVVVAFHAPDLLDRCLTALGDGPTWSWSTTPPTPGWPAVADRHGAQYVDPGRNLGFGAGANVGCTYRHGRDVLLLNPDAAITPDGVRGLHAALHADGGLAAVAPRQHDPDRLDEARVGWPFPTPAGAWIEAAGLGRLRRRTDFLIGSVLLLSAAALDDVGGFDEQFFLYAEETDWQRRAVDRGWRVAVCQAVVATHVGAGTGGDPVARETHFQASHERYVRKHHGTAGWWSYRAAALAGAGVRAVVLPGERREAAGLRLRLFRTGPLRAEASSDGPACAWPTWSSPMPSPGSSGTSARWPTAWPSAATRWTSSAARPTGCGPSSTTRWSTIRPPPWWQGSGRWSRRAGPTWCTPT